MIQMNLFTKQKETYRYRKQTYSYQRGNMGGGGIYQELEMNIHTLLYIRQITDKDLLYSTGSCTQYSVLTYMRKESKKRMNIHICITESRCCTPKLTQHCKSTILQ